MHGHDPFRTPQISRSSRACTIHTRADDTRLAFPLFTQSDLLSRGHGEFQFPHVLRFPRYSPLHIKLGIEPLRDLAFIDIQSKVTSENVVAELFSSFTSRLVHSNWNNFHCNTPSTEDRESEVMKMHGELLRGKFRGKSTTVSTTDFIKTMVGGNAAHRAGALKLALRDTRPRSGVLLRCPCRSCDFHHDHISYRSLGSRLTCQTSHFGGGYYILQCAQCGGSRTDNYTSCQRCGKDFM